jgi:hypothetical protein
MERMTRVPPLSKYSGSFDSRQLAWGASASGALVLPALLAFNLPPSSTFLNQATALVGWGCWLAVIVAAMPNPALPRSAGMTALQCALALLLLAAMASRLWTGLPWSLALSSAGLIGAAALVAYVAVAAQRGGVAQPAFRAFRIDLVVAGVASSAIGIVRQGCVEIRCDAHFPLEHAELDLPLRLRKHSDAHERLSVAADHQRSGIKCCCSPATQAAGGTWGCCFGHWDACLLFDQPNASCMLDKQRSIS